MRFSVGQLKSSSEITGNIAVAWFAAGVISPLLTRPNILDFLFRFSLSFLMTGVFSVISLELVKEVKS